MLKKYRVVYFTKQDYIFSGFLCLAFLTMNPLLRETALNRPNGYVLFCFCFLNACIRHYGVDENTITDEITPFLVNTHCVSQV